MGGALIHNNNNPEKTIMPEVVLIMLALCVAYVVCLVVRDARQMYRAWRARRAARGLAERQEQGRREVAAYLELIAAAQPILPTDEFGTCPNPDCDMDSIHHILKIEGNTSHRACTFCLHRFTIDHNTRTGGTA